MNVQPPDPEAEVQRSTGPAEPTKSPLPGMAAPGYYVDRRRPEVPYRTIAATIAMVLGTYVILWLLRATTQILTWVFLSAFFAIVLNPLVDVLVNRLRMRRGFAVAFVTLAVLGLLSVMIATFISPVAKQGSQFARDLPGYVQDAQEGRGKIGEFIKERKLDEWATENVPKLQERFTSFLEPKKAVGSAVGAIGSVFNGVASFLTILVMTILMLTQGRGLMMSAIRPLAPHHQARMMRLGRESARAVTGYVAGNLLISAIAGVATFMVLSIIGVPYAGVLGLWVAFADLIPLIGATLGAIPTVIVAFLHSTTAGIITLVFYVLYQQFENHVLQTTIMSKTVALQPLVVLISVLIGVEILGLLGALVAIPLAAVIKVVGSDIIANRRPDLVSSPPPTG